MKDLSGFSQFVYLFMTPFANPGVILDRQFTHTIIICPVRFEVIIAMRSFGL